MSMDVIVESITHHGTHQDERLNRVVDVTVNFKIASAFGELILAVPVKDAPGLDHAIDMAEEQLAKWAQQLQAATRRR